MHAEEHDPVRITAQSYEAGAAAWHEAHRAENRATTRGLSYDRFADLLAHRGLVLDLGCGSGLDVAALSARGLTVVGLDISAAMLRLARREAPGLAGRLLRGDLRALPIAAGALDGVWADGSLHHLPRAQLGCALREIARVLRAGGIFGMSAERGSFQGFVQQQEGVAGRRWYAYCEAEDLRAAVEAANLSVVDLVVGGANEHTCGFVGLLARR